MKLALAAVALVLAGCVTYQQQPWTAADQAQTDLAIQLLGGNRSTTPMPSGQVYFLRAQDVNRYGNRFCQYQNGTVLNVGNSMCPPNIR